VWDPVALAVVAEDLRPQTEQVILEEIAALRDDAGAERQQLVVRQRRALTEQAKLLDAHHAGAIPLDLLRIEQERITGERGRSCGNARALGAPVRTGAHVGAQNGARSIRSSSARRSAR
jgi:hypothetical protein